MGFQASIHLHSSLDGRDTLGNTKLRVIQEHRTPHVQDIIGVVYENATTKVLNCFFTVKFSTNYNFLIFDFSKLVGL